MTENITRARFESLQTEAVEAYVRTTIEADEIHTAANGTALIEVAHAMSAFIATEWQVLIARGIDRGLESSKREFRRRLVGEKGATPIDGMSKAKADRTMRLVCPLMRLALTEGCIDEIAQPWLDNGDHRAVAGEWLAFFAMIGAHSRADLLKKTTVKRERTLVQRLFTAEKALFKAQGALEGLKDGASETELDAAAHLFREWLDNR